MYSRDMPISVFFLFVTLSVLSERHEAVETGQRVPAVVPAIDSGNLSNVCNVQGVAD